MQAWDEIHPLESLSPWRREAWLKAVAPDEPHKLARRLLWDRADVASLERQWSKQEEGAWTTSDPGGLDGGDEINCSWWQTLKACQEVLRANWEISLLPYDAKGQLPFIDLWWPIRCFGAKWLRQSLDDLPHNWISIENVSEQLADSLLERLCALGDQVLWHHFKQNRTPGEILLAHLGAAGDGSGPPLRDTYEAFIRSHRRDGIASLLREYPVLGRLVGTVVMLWQQASEEMLRRVAADWPVLVSSFCLEPEHRLCTVTYGLSDPHRGGRGVAILGFTTNQPSEDIRIVYKPKDMGVDAAYQMALSDLNAHSSLPPLRVLRVHVADGYGYMEYVRHQLCDSEKELKRFYANAGRLAAILYVLGCTDCHFENLIASGDQLLLIDTETLLEPELPDHIDEATTHASVVATSLLQRRLHDSVLRSGLLPQMIVMGNANRAIDISAMGVTPPSDPFQPAPGWLGLNSDGMMEGLVSRASELPTSLPVGIGCANPFQRHLEPFCNGFEEQCLVMQAHYQRWVAPDGPLFRFRGLNRRIVLRATRVYFTIQRQLLSPDALRSSFAQDMVLEQLARSFLLADVCPLNWPVFTAEVCQMRRLDIPFFTHRIADDSLCLADGLSMENESNSPLDVDRLSGFFRTSSLTLARQRLQALDSVEINFQIQLIRGAAAALDMSNALIFQHPNLNPDDKSAIPECTVHPVPHFSGCDAAIRVVHLLLKAATVDHDGDIEWLGLDLEADGKSFRFGVVGNSLYGGTIGIACLLFRVHAFFKDSGLPTIDTDLHLLPNSSINAILRPLRELGADSRAGGRLRWWRDQPLGMNGCGGLLLALQVLEEWDLVETLLEAMLLRFLRNDRQLNLISGCAGLIGPLLRQGGETANRLALASGDQILQQLTNHGVEKFPPFFPGLTGFTHGSAGVASALANLHTVCGEQRFLAAASTVLADERTRLAGYDSFSPTTSGMSHGAAGIALGRACLWGTALWDDRCLEEIEIAVQAMAAQREIHCDSVSFGRFGLLAVLELCAEAPWLLNSPARALSDQAAQRWRVQALTRCEDQVNGQSPFRCFPTSNEAMVLPGFFTGLSGIGLAMLEDSQSRSLLASLLSAGLWPASPECDPHARKT